MKNEKRYQDCSLPIRLWLWRRRWYLMIPWYFITGFVGFWSIRYPHQTDLINLDTGEQSTTMSPKLSMWWHAKFAWGFSIGSAQKEMNWYYNLEESKARVESATGELPGNRRQYRP
jgi:hypothetical protein